MKEIKSDNQKNNINLEVDTFKKDETYASQLRKEAEVLRDKELVEEKQKSKIKNLKLFGKVIGLSILCATSIKGYKLVESKVVEIEEDIAMKDYYNSMAQAIMNNKYFLKENGIVDQDKYAYHYDRIGEYIDEVSEQTEGIETQNKYVPAKDFYIASAVKYFDEYYGDINKVINNTKSTGDCTTLKEYVKMLGYSSTDQYVDSVYEINYSVNKSKVKK